MLLDLVAEPGSRAMLEAGRGGGRGGREPGVTGEPIEIETFINAAHVMRQQQWWRLSCGGGQSVNCSVGQSGQSIQTTDIG